MPRTPKQEDFLTTARKSQEIMADAIRTWVETVRTATPSLSSFYTPLANRLPKVPSISVSITGKLPRPQEAVASAYDLAERLLASQRKFAVDLVKATRPLMPGFGVSEPEGHSETTAVAQSAPRETAAEKAPEAAAPKSTTKTAPTRRAPKSTATSRAPRSTATRRAPKSSDSD